MLLVSLISSCSIVGGIFKAGMTFGIFLVMIVIIAIVVLLLRMNKNNPK
jgi:hypothetical protein